jgi:Domain of unknown function (DUF1918)
MAQTQTSVQAEVGDLVVIDGHRVGGSRRIGEILAVLGEPGHEHYRVRWDDDHEGVLYPSSDATIQHAEHRGKKRGKKP